LREFLNALLFTFFFHSLTHGHSLCDCQMPHSIKATYSFSWAMNAKCEKTSLFALIMSLLLQVGQDPSDWLPAGLDMVTSMRFQTQRKKNYLQSERWKENKREMKILVPSVVLQKDLCHSQKTKNLKNLTTYWEWSFKNLKKIPWFKIILNSSTRTKTFKNIKFIFSYDNGQVKLLMVKY